MEVRTAAAFISRCSGNKHHTKSFPPSSVNGGLSTKDFSFVKTTIICFIILAPFTAKPFETLMRIASKLPAPSFTRNLIYHICPLPNTSWLWNVEQLAKRWPVFNGRKYLVVAEGKGLTPVSKIETILTEILPLDSNTEIYSYPNDPVARETATFSFLMHQVANQNSNEITFYGHTKGTTRSKEMPSRQKAIKLWTAAMYHHDLDRIPEIELLLQTHACAGSFKRYGRFKNFPRNSLWHYSGTFFWFRHDKLFTRKWDIAPKHRYGTEAYLSLLFHKSEAGCIFGDRAGDMYDLKTAERILGIRK